MSFADQLSRSRQGDPAAQEELFGRWRPLLLLQARRLLGSELAARADPSDVVQNSLLQATQDQDKFRGTSQGEWVAWLRCIVDGQAAKVRRFHQAEKRGVGREEVTADSALPDRHPGIVRRLIDEEEAGRLACAIQDLAEPMREMVIRRVLEGEPIATVAKALNLTAPRSRSLLTQALRQLARALIE
jgi:RNA polymerase sigma-70 factor (ECF subfamily)